MKGVHRTLNLLCLVCLIVLSTTGSWAGDIKGSSDHPMISRYEGSSITRYITKEFDEFSLITEKVIKANIRPSGSPKLEGHITRITYETPAGRSTLEVIRNYESELKKAGFDIMYQCKNNECGGRSFNHTVVEYCCGFSENYSDQRYFAAKLPRPEGDIHIALYVVLNSSEGGPRRNRIYTQLDIVESRAMQEGMVKVNADAMAQSLSDTGRVALYGIYFDTNKTEVKSESKPTLVEIGKLLKNNSALKIVVVGHTDNKGSFDYNMNLSKKRAKAVADILVTDYSIDRSRLIHWGVGFLSPVASNKNEQGRAKNRRVELVEQ